jgi:uncharacterized repeat protein (TIGR03803 family)
MFIYGDLAKSVILLVVATAVLSAPSQAQTFSDLYNFGTNSGDPIQPGSPGIIAQGRDGNLYSTTEFGGPNGWGTAFKITPEGTVTVLYGFDTDTYGLFPVGGLTLGTDGNLYGSTSNGPGSSGKGTVFKITPGGKPTLLHVFGTDASRPFAPPIQGTDGIFYGTTFGDKDIGDYGGVYKMTPSGNLTFLYRFDITHGAGPVNPLVQGRDGKFYGTTTSGGIYDKGTLFNITPNGGFTVIHNFGKTKGYSSSPLVQGSDGYFYGQAHSGGTGEGRLGTIFRVTPTGKFTVLHNFNPLQNGDDGAYPDAGLVQATDGNLYGAATGDEYGTIYRISPQGGFSVLYTFLNPSMGVAPQVTLLNHTNGTLYGDTYGGGNLSNCNFAGCGVFYSLDVGLGPFVSFVPVAGKVGKTIEFLGQGFNGTTAVSFNGTAASFMIKSDTYLTAIVPTGATTGFVTVSTPGGVLTSNKQFRVEP